MPKNAILPHLAALVAACATLSCHESSSTITGTDTSTDTRTDTTADTAPDTPAPCFRACAGSYFSGSSGCIDERHACRLGCEGFGDWACHDRCEEEFDTCTWDLDDEMETCLEGCPCWLAFSGCVESCDWPGDSCWSGCEREFNECSGDDISGLGGCVEECAISSGDCSELCEEHHGEDWEAWVGCTTDCETHFTGCMQGCF